MSTCSPTPSRSRSTRRATSASTSSSWERADAWRWNATVPDQIPLGGSPGLYARDAGPCCRCFGTSVDARTGLLSPRARYEASGVPKGCTIATRSPHDGRKQPEKLGKTQESATGRHGRGDGRATEESTYTPGSVSRGFPSRAGMFPARPHSRHSLTGPNPHEATRTVIGGMFVRLANTQRAHLHPPAHPGTLETSSMMRLRVERAEDQLTGVTSRSVVIQA